MRLLISVPLCPCVNNSVLNNTPLDRRERRPHAEFSRKDKAMTEDEQQLNLLSIFHYVLAALTALFSCLLLFHIAMGIAIVCGAMGDEGPPPFFGWIFILMPSFLLLAGWTLAGLMVAAGRRLKRRASHTFCLVVACIECLMMPFGTVLGIFTIIVLSRESVKELFAAKKAFQATRASSGE